MDKVNVKNEAIEVENVETVAETAVQNEVVADDTNRVEIVTAKVTRVTAKFVPVYIYDEDSDKWVTKRDEDGNTIQRKLVTLKLNKEVHRILDESHGFEDVMTDTLTFSRHSLQHVISEIDGKVSRKLVKLQEQTKMTEASLSAIMALLENAIISLRVIVRLPGDIYFVDGEQRTVEHKNYFYDIFDVEVDDDSYDEFNDEIKEQINDWKDAQREAKADAKERLAIEAAARANVLNSTDAPF